MTTLRAYDGATPWSPVRLRQAKQHGAIAVSVYIVGTPGGMPHADKADVAAALSAGLGVLPNWERAADFFRTASIADCTNAGKEALAACRAVRLPDDGSVGVAFSFDYEVAVGRYAHATDQLKACGDGMGGHYQPLGYAQIDLINYWAAHGMPGPHWLMGSTWRASSQFTKAEVGSAHVAMVQSHDANGNWLNSPVAGTDVNTVTQPHKLAAYWPAGSPYTPTPAPKPVPPQEDEVSAADVIAALKSTEGQALLTDAVKPFFHDAHGKQVSADTILADRLLPITAQLKAIAADVAAIKAAKS